MPAKVRDEQHAVARDRGAVWGQPVCGGDDQLGARYGVPGVHIRLPACSGPCRYVLLHVWPVCRKK
jgi:hypothetical protein